MTAKRIILTNWNLHCKRGEKAHDTCSIHLWIELECVGGQHHAHKLSNLSASERSRCTLHSIQFVDNFSTSKRTVLYASQRWKDCGDVVWLCQSWNFTFSETHSKCCLRNQPSVCSLFIHGMNKMRMDITAAVLHLQYHLAHESTYANAGEIFSFGEQIFDKFHCWLFVSKLSAMPFIMTLGTVRQSDDNIL